ncbi:MAG: VPLPA-CTERM sorting domain-containing protein, partial [Gammaproteobacteria bacterium]|nr:VPLPA-CTERM sorting domain-containing protein [Gammaproteobacteria bacterium]
NLLRGTIFSGVLLLAAANPVYAFSVNQYVSASKFGTSTTDPTYASAGYPGDGQWSSAQATAGIGTLSINMEAYDDRTYDPTGKDYAKTKAFAEFRDVISFASDAGFVGDTTLYATIETNWQIHRDFTRIYTGDLVASFGDSPPLYNALASLWVSGNYGSASDSFREIDWSTDPHFVGLDSSFSINVPIYQPGSGFTDLSFIMGLGYTDMSAGSGDHKIYSAHTQLSNIITPDGVTFTTTSGVLATPIPGAVWLFASGLIGLAGLAKRKKRA